MENTPEEGPESARKTGIAVDGPWLIMSLGHYQPWYEDVKRKSRHFVKNASRKRRIKCKSCPFATKTHLVRIENSSIT